MEVFPYHLIPTQRTCEENHPSKRKGTYSWVPPTYSQDMALDDS